MALAASALLFLAACAPPANTNDTANLTPLPSPSPSASPGPTPSSSSATSQPTIAPPTPSHAPILQITSATFHAAEVGVAFSPVTLLATGGVGSYTWSISAGSLPAGLTATTAGVVSGTPTAAGTAAFTVHVADQASGSAIVNRSISVARHLSVSALCAAQCNVEVGCTTVCGKFGTLGGGVGPFRYATAGGTSVPPGMALNGLSVTGPFPPEPPGALPIPWRFTATVSDSFGVTASVNAIFGTFVHIALGNYNNATAFPTTGGTFTMPLSSSPLAGTVSVKLIKGTLPANTTYYADTAKQVVVVQVGQQPIRRIALPYSLTFQVTDQALCGPAAGQLCSAIGTATFSAF